MEKEGPATPAASSLLAAEVLLERPVTPNWADPNRRVVCVARSRRGCCASPSTSSSASQERVRERRLPNMELYLATEHPMRLSACGLRLAAGGAEFIGDMSCAFSDRG